MNLNTVGERIKYARLRKGLTQEAAAEYLRVARTTYGHYEAGRNEPDIETLTKMATIFDTTLDFILTGKSEENCSPRDPVPTPPVNQQQSDLARMLDQALHALQMHEETSRIQAETMRLQAENERLRIEKVDAVAQENLKRILDKLDQLGSEAHTEGRDDEGAAGGSESLVG